MKRRQEAAEKAEQDRIRAEEEAKAALAEIVKNVTKSEIVEMIQNPSKMKRIYRKSQNPITRRTNLARNPTKNSIRKS